MSEYDQAVQYEDGIVWLEDPEGFYYVRETIELMHFRRRQPPWRGRDGRLVGYSVLTLTAPSTFPGMFLRRLFWLKDYDRDSGDPIYSRGAPCEAVDPRHVKPGVQSQGPDRWEGAAED